MFVIMKWSFDQWDCIGTATDMENAIDIREKAFDDSFKDAIGKWECWTTRTEIGNTIGITRDNDRSWVWAAFAIRQIDVPTEIETD
jgi:hypothetical protein